MRLRLPTIVPNLRIGKVLFDMFYSVTMGLYSCISHLTIAVKCTKTASQKVHPNTKQTAFGSSDVFRDQGGGGGSFDGSRVQGKQSFGSADFFGEQDPGYSINLLRFCDL